MSDSHSQIDRVIADLESAQVRLFELSARTPDEKWARRSNPASWSIAECVEHLNITSRAYLPLIRDALANSTHHPTGDSSPSKFHRDVPGFLLGAMIGPLKKIGRFRIGRVKTLPEFEPRNDAPRQQPLDEFENLQTQLLRVIRSSQNASLSEIKIVSPFGGKLRYNLYSAYKILPRHQHRHLQQAEDVWPPRSGR